VDKQLTQQQRGAIRDYLDAVAGACSRDSSRVMTAGASGVMEIHDAITLSIEKLQQARRLLGV